MLMVVLTCFWPRGPAAPPPLVIHVNVYSRLDVFTSQTTMILIHPVLSLLTRWQIKWLPLKWKAGSSGASSPPAAYSAVYIFHIFLNYFGPSPALSVHVGGCGVFVQIGLQLSSIHVFDCFVRRGRSCWHQLLLQGYCKACIYSIVPQLNPQRVFCGCWMRPFTLRCQDSSTEAERGLHPPQAWKAAGIWKQDLLDLRRQGNHLSHFRDEYSSFQLQSPFDDITSDELAWFSAAHHGEPELGSADWPELPFFTLL